MVREQPYTAGSEVEAERHCDEHEMRNCEPARGDGPSKVSAVSVHEATNTVGANLSHRFDATEGGGVAAL